MTGVCLGLAVSAWALSSGSDPAPAGASGGSAVSGGSVVVGVAQPWEPVDPLFTASTIDEDIDSSVFGSLFQLTSSGQLKPELATKITASNELKTYTITLRQGVKFQDGTPFNAAAVVFNLQRVSNPANGCRCYTAVKDIASVSAQSNSTVLVQLNAPDVTFPNTMSSQAGMMASPTAARSEGQNFAERPIGAGPFKFQSQTPGNSITLAKWKGYWDAPRPYLNSVTYRLLADSNSRSASIQSGAIQIDQNVGAAQLATIQSDSAVKVDHLSGLGTTFVQFQTKNSPFTDVRARDAVTYATNPKSINHALYSGLETTGIQSPWTPASWAYPGKRVANYPTYNLAKAKQLVKQLGGLSFTFSIPNTSGAIDLAEALQSQWAAAGIKANISEQDTLTLIDNSSAGKFQAMLYQWIGSYEPDNNVDPFFATGGLSNAVKLSDPVVDALLSAERSTSSRPERQAIFSKMAARLAQDAPYDYLMVNSVWLGYSDTVHGVVALKNGGFNLSQAWISG
jgi:peptide/nickel transport system substrate-binding protein